MQTTFNTYIPGRSIVHTCDPRVKLILLLVYSITLFVVTSWAGLGICTALCLVTCLVASIRFNNMAALLIPLYVILVFTIVFNSFSFDMSSVAQAGGLGDVSAGFLAGTAPIPLFGNVAFVPAGFMRGCFYALRIVLLVLASLVVSLTTKATDLTDAFAGFLRPLRTLRVPVDDVAMMISLALRFIPVTAEEVAHLYTAQKSRGAAFDEKGVFVKIKAWQAVFIPLFIRLFRRADNVALAMETRCYGMSSKRSRLHPRKFTIGSAVVVIVGIMSCFLLGWFL